MQLGSSYFLKILVFASLCLSKNGFAQTIPDSLLQKLKQSSNDSIKARTLLQIGESIEIEAPEKSMQYYNTALSVSKKTNNNECIFLAYINIGNCYVE
ncbi:MAG: hypothetical protein ABI091_07205 [Ferruginibacter sp.]